MVQTFLSISSQVTSHPDADVTFLLWETTTHWHIATPDGSVRAVLKKRTAYPVTFCRQIDRSTVVLGYGASDQDEFLNITLESSGSVHIIRDNMTTLPLFYTANTEMCVVSNEYADVVQAVQRPRISEAAIVEHLMMHDRPLQPSIEGVLYLKEREQLVYMPGSGATIMQPQGRDWQFSHDVPPTDPRAFFDDWSSYLDYFMQTRFAGQRVAYEVSGGLDSATLPQYAYAQTREPVLAASMLLGTPYPMQRAKLQDFAIQTEASFVMVTLDPGAMAPLTHVAAPHFAEKLYQPSVAQLVQQLRVKGVDVVATGCGGDELFSNVTEHSFGMQYGQRAYEARSAFKLPPFYTQAFRQTYLAATPKTPLLPLPHRPANTSFGQLANNVYIREDIWPVSPFMSSELYRYVQGLPAHFRTSKHMLRAFHKAKGFTRSIYSDMQKEYFDVFFRQCFLAGSFDQLMDRVIQQSHTVALGLVDAGKLKEAYMQARTMPSYDDDALFRLFLFLSVESSLQEVPGLVPPRP